MFRLLARRRCCQSPAIAAHCAKLAGHGRYLAISPGPCRQNPPQHTPWLARYRARLLRIRVTDARSCASLDRSVSALFASPSRRMRWARQPWPAAGGVYGSYQTGTAAPAGFAFSFVAAFAYALHRVKASAPAPPKHQIMLVLAMICFSFGLHTVYLPAGICCFFTLMLCKNELLMPKPTQPLKHD